MINRFDCSSNCRESTFVKCTLHKYCKVMYTRPDNCRQLLKNLQSKYLDQCVNEAELSQLFLKYDLVFFREVDLKNFILIKKNKLSSNEIHDLKTITKKRNHNFLSIFISIYLYTTYLGITTEYIINIIMYYMPTKMISKKKKKYHVRSEFTTSALPQRCSLPTVPQRPCLNRFFRGYEPQP